MRRTTAAILTATALPRPYASSRPISLEEIETDAAGPGEVLVEVASVGVCHSDLSALTGAIVRKTPMVLGHEAAGIVVEIGPSVTGIERGDHVVFTFVPSCGTCMPCATGRPALCLSGNAVNRAGTLMRGTRRFSRDGEVLYHHNGVSGFSQLTVCAQESLVVVPRETPMEIAAVFGCAALTGIGAAVNTGNVRFGSSVAVFGAGGVGFMALLGALAAGARQVIVVEPNAEKRRAALDLGATAAIDPLSDDAPAAIRDLTGGVDCAIETVGRADVLRSAFDATGLGGKIVTLSLPPGDALASIPHTLLVNQEKSLLGSYMGSCVPKRDIPRYVAMWRAGRLPVDRLVTSVADFAHLNEAFDELARGKHIRAVAHPQSLTGAR